MYSFSTLAAVTTTGASGRESVVLSSSGRLSYTVIGRFLLLLRFCISVVILIGSGGALFIRFGASSLYGFTTSQRFRKFA